MTDNTNTSAVFAAFIEADRALKELPEVKRQLDETKALADTHADNLASERSKTDMLQSTIETLRAELAAKEAALADATKSAESSANLLNGLRGLLGVVDAGTKEVTVTPSEAIPSVSAGTSAEGSSVTVQPLTESNESSPDAPSGQRDSDPTSVIEATSVGAAKPSQDVGSTIESPISAVIDTKPSVDSNPPEVANTAPAPTFPLDLRSDPNGQPSDVVAATAGTDNTGLASSQPSELSAESVAASPARQPASDKPYWINWQDWKDLHNGEVPAYVKDLTAV